MKTFWKVSALVFFLLVAIVFAPRVTDAAAPVSCSANPSTAVVGTLITITCSGFDANTWVNTYVVEPTGFTEVGDSDYAACVLNSQKQDGAKGQTDKTGSTTFYWQTQSGRDEGHCDGGTYEGYANQIGTYTFVVQELDGVGGIKYKGTVEVTLNGRTDTYSGAALVHSSNVVVPGTFNLVGSGFAAGENVSVWFTRPADCSGQGYPYWTGDSAFDPGSDWGARNGVEGPSNVKTDASGSFAAVYTFANFDKNGTPCLGSWSVTARALGSGIGAEGTFQVNGSAVLNNVKVWTSESSVPSIGQTFNSDQGIGVHVYGSGFPAGSRVNCWFTRPDGTVDEGFVSTQVDASGNFAAVAVSYTSEIATQGEQLGRWAVTCGTPDGKYSGVAWFNVVGLLDP